MLQALAALGEGEDVIAIRVVGPIDKNHGRGHDVLVIVRKEGHLGDQVGVYMNRLWLGY